MLFWPLHVAWGPNSPGKEGHVQQVDQPAFEVTAADIADKGREFEKRKAGQHGTRKGGLHGILKVGLHGSLHGGLRGGLKEV